MREYSGAHRAARRARSTRAAPARPAALARHRAARQPGARDRAVRRARAHPRGRASRTRSRTCRRARRPDLLRQVEQRLPYVSLEPQAGGRYLIRTAAPLGDAPGRDGPLRRRDLSGAGTARGAVRGGAALVLAVRRPGGAARAAEVQLPPHAHPGAAAGDAGRHLRRHLLRRSAWCARCRTSSRARARSARATSARACRCRRATRWASWCTPSTT